MGPNFLGLLLLAVAGSCADPAPTTVAAPSIEKSHKGCSLYCFITPKRDERVNFTLYNNLSCTHFVYGFGEMTTSYQYKGPSWQDEATHSYSGNFYYLRNLKKTNPSASILLGVNLNEHDSLLSYAPTRAKLAFSALREARSLHVDGLFFRVDRPFIDNSRFAHFFKDLSTSNISLPVTLGVPLPLLSHSLTHVLDASLHVEAVFVMSTPSFHKLTQVDPLLPTETTPPEQTISYHVQELVDRGVSKKKIVVGLTAGAVVYKNYIVNSLNQEAEGRQAGIQETCGLHGEKILDSVTATEMVRSGHTWISSNAPQDDALGKKVRWLTSAGYGGIGLQSLQYDDPEGKCESGKPFPALRMATENMECRPEEHAKSCTRLCYINAARPLAKLTPSACSHIVVEASLSALGEVKLSPEGIETAKWIRGWHTANKPKLMISVGARQTSDIWRIALAIPLYRQQVVKQLKELLTEWRATGVELSWTLGPLDFITDATNLETLLVEMRKELGDTATLALAVSHVSSYQDRYKSMTKLSSTIDLIVLHSHRFHSSRQPFTGHHSPLFYTSDILFTKVNSVEGLVAYWSATQKMPRSKIVVGITAEPLSMNLAGQDRADESPFGMMATPSFSIPHPPALRADDINGKKDMKAVDGKSACELEKDPNSRKQWIESLSVPFLVNGAQFVAYDNERSVQMKTTWSSLNQLGGIALFDAQLDDVEGECSRAPFPLLSAIVRAQVCETCVPEDVDGLPCMDPFTTSCSYRLPTRDERDAMPGSKIPHASCTQIVVEEVLLKADGAIHFRDETAKKAMSVLAQPKVGMKRLIVAIRCQMEKEEFDEILKNGPSAVHTLLSFMANYSLSGVELACDNLVDEKRKTAFSSLLTGLRTALLDSTPFKKCPHSLSLRLPFSTLDLSSKYDIAVLNEIKHVVLEPFNDPVRNNTAHINTPLFPANGHTDDIDTTVRAWQATGLDKSKIIIQIPAYATLQDMVSNVTEIGAATTNGTLIKQAQVCSLLKTASSSKMMWDRIATHAVVGEGKRQWMSMQNQETIAYKVFYAIREELGGTGLLSLNDDDWAGKCGSGPFPLLTAAKARCLAQLPPSKSIL